MVQEKIPVRANSSYERRLFIKTSHNHNQIIIKLMNVELLVSCTNVQVGFIYYSVLICIIYMSITNFQIVPSPQIKLNNRVQDFQDCSFHFNNCVLHKNCFNPYIRSYILKPLMVTTQYSMHRMPRVKSIISEKKKSMQFPA